MRLTELVHIVSSQFRAVENLIRHPRAILMQRGQRAAEERFAQLEIPVKPRSPQSDVQVPSSTTESFRLANLSSPVQQTHSSNRATSQLLAPHVPLALLSKEDSIQGRRGKYQCINILASTERFNLYQGIQISNDKSVFIKQYLLPEREFNQSEVQARKERFINLTNLNFKTNGGQDFRLILPWDAIASTQSTERCCYLITEPIPNSISLRNYVAQETISAAQVRCILKQVLQTLWFLHSQKVRFGNGEIRQEFPHGNLNLDSLLLVNAQPANGLKEPQFQIYVTDLGLWEPLFVPPNTQVINPLPSQDLVDLGRVAVLLLTGKPMAEPVVGRSINPELVPQWNTLSDQPLKQFVQRLLELDRPPFASALTARETLLTLPEPQPEATAATFNEQDSPDRPQWILIAAILGMLGILGLMLAVALWGMRSLKTPQSSPSGSIASLSCNPPQNTSENNLPPCNLNQVNLPARFTYAVESGGSWDNALRKTGLVGENVALMNELRQRNLTLNRYPKPTFVSSNAAIAQVQSGQINFALINQFDKQPPDDLTGLIAVPVAYDGLGVFVAFSDAASDATKQSSIPNQLNGRISLEQLRQLYVGKVDDWEKPAGLSNWTVKLYLPSEPGSIKQFETQVLRQQQAIDEFNRLRSRSSTSTIQVIQQNEYQIFGNILQDFENDPPSLGIGVGLLSKAFGQCSIYPLAVSVGNRDQAVQPLIQNNHKPVDPTIDLCSDKGGYSLNVDAFKLQSGRYPLTISLMVIYKESDRTHAGQQFAAMLQTEEGQRLLRETGLVPIRELPN